MRQFARSHGPPADVLPIIPHGTPARWLIRSETTNRFLTRDRTWTRDVDEAASFPDMCAACDLKRQLGMTHVELYYLFGSAPDARYDFALPLN